MIDIHHHLIYGLDDGPQTIEQSMAMINTAYADGIRTIVATPHYNAFFKYDMELLLTRYEEIKERAASEFPSINIYIGNECYLDEKLLDALLKGKCRTLANSRYVLIELSHSLPHMMAKMMLTDIIANGFIPVIAHCERLLTDKNGTARVLELKELGCLLQVNASFFLESQKFWVKLWLYSAFKKRTIDFVSSDAHDIIRRKPVLSSAYKKASKKIGKDIANSVFSLNAQIIINSAI